MSVEAEPNKRSHVSGVSRDGPRAISVISDRPPAPTWLFALAAAAGAVALAVIFGLRQVPAAVLIFIPPELAPFSAAA